MLYKNTPFIYNLSVKKSLIRFKNWRNPHALKRFWGFQSVKVLQRMSFTYCPFFVSKYQLIDLLLSYPVFDFTKMKRSLIESSFPFSNPRNDDAHFLGWHVRRDNLSADAADKCHMISKKPIRDTNIFSHFQIFLGWFCLIPINRPVLPEPSHWCGSLWLVGSSSCDPVRPPSPPLHPQIPSPPFDLRGRKRPSLSSPCSSWRSAAWKRENCEKHLCDYHDTVKFFSIRNSQSDDVCVGVVHWNRYGVFLVLVFGVVVGASFQEQTNQPETAK